LNQRDLSGTEPAFEFFLALNGSAYVIGRFESYKAIAVVARGEAFVGFGLVFEGAMAKVAGDSDVEGAAFAGDDVGEVGVVAHELTIDWSALCEECFESHLVVKSRSFAYHPHADENAWGPVRSG